MIIEEIGKTIWVGIKGGLDIILSILPFYQQLNGLQDEMLAIIFGVPVAAIPLIRLIVKFFKTNKN